MCFGETMKLRPISWDTLRAADHTAETEHKRNAETRTEDAMKAMRLLF